jgi:MATE family multidrug resistance protein
MVADASQHISLRVELKDTLVLAGPIVLNQVGHISMGMVDTLVAGRISTTALGGLGLAANFFWTFTSVCVGCLLALDTYFSQAAGARNETALSRYLGQAFWSAAMVTVVSGVCILVGCALYLHYSPSDELRSAFGGYVHVIIWCLPSLYYHFVLQRYWQARQRVFPFTVIILSANVLNLLACTAFGLGLWGFPRLGVRGIAVSTVISRYAMLIAAVAFTRYELGPGVLRLPRLDLAVQRQFFRLGLPAAGHTALEISAFTFVTFVVGGFGAAPLAAHNACLMMAAFTFMFPLGFGSAAAVRVGTFIGAGQPRHARVAGWLCIGVAVVVMSCFAVGYLAFPRFLLRCFTSDPAVIDVGVKILVLVALFQIADGTQVSTTGALRGLGNTRAAMIANLIGHYPIGLALGLVLCFVFKFGVVGLWTGLAAGLISVALMLVRAWTNHTRDLTKLKPISATAGGPGVQN